MKLERGLSDFPVLSACVEARGKLSLSAALDHVKTGLRRGSLPEGRVLDCVYEVGSSVRFPEESVMAQIGVPELEFDQRTHAVIEELTAAFPALNNAFGRSWGPRPDSTTETALESVLPDVLTALKGKGLPGAFEKWLQSALSELVDFRVWVGAAEDHFAQLRAAKAEQKKAGREAAAQVFSADVSRYPLLAAAFEEGDAQARADAIGTRRRPSLMEFPRLLETLAKGLELGILNPVYETLKERFNRGIERLFEKLEAEAIPRWHTPEHEARQSFFEACSEAFPYGVALSNVAATRKKLEAVLARSEDVPNKLRHIAGLLNELMPVVAAMGHLKDKVIKRGAKKETEADVDEDEAEVRRELVRRRVPEALSARLKEVFTQATESQKNALKDYFQRQHLLLLDGLNAMGVEESARRAGFGSVAPERDEMLSASEMEVFRVVSRRDGRNGPWMMATAQECNRLLANLAEQKAEHLRRGFVFKTTLKVASVIDAKGVEFSVLHVPGVASLGRLQGDFLFEFVDGSSFRIDCSSEVSTSVYGNAFARYPTRFHDVVLEDGSAMTFPSEERMNTVFAAVLYGSVTADKASKGLLTGMGVRLGERTAEGRLTVCCSRSVAAELEKFRADFDPQLHAFAPALVLGLSEDEQRAHALGRQAWDDFHGARPDPDKEPVSELLRGRSVRVSDETPSP